MSTKTTASTIIDDILDYEYGLITISKAAMLKAYQKGNLKLVKNVYEEVRIGGKGNIYMEVLENGQSTNIILLHIKYNRYKIIPHFVNIIEDGNFDNYKFNQNKKNIDLVSILGSNFKFSLSGEKNVVMTQFKKRMLMTIKGACLERIIVSLMLNSGVIKNIPKEIEVHHKSWRSIAMIEAINYIPKNEHRQFHSLFGQNSHQHGVRVNTINEFDKLIDEVQKIMKDCRNKRIDLQVYWDGTYKYRNKGSINLMCNIMI
ncbi:MAG TPA: hypothetical protein VJZ04_01460 [Lachnospiraceae bacterium]|nr:hypothetical protein [Lachnospiraceae bacterium]